MTRPTCIAESCNRKATKTRALCTKCHDTRQDARYAEARAIVAKGVCPSCSSGIKRNLALTGWYQCEQYGAPGFRKDSTKPACSFQTFTR